MGVADFLGDKSSLFIQVKAVYTQNKKQKGKKREKMLRMIRITWSTYNKFWEFN